MGSGRHDVQVRPATPDDAAGIAEVHVRAWQAAYRGIVADEFLDAMDVGQRTERWRQNLAPAGQQYRTFVAVERGTERIIGFSGQGPARDEDTDAGVGEIAAIYAHPDRWSTGVGRALMEAALADLSAAGHTNAILWTFRDNARARHFYEQAGWVHDGSTKTFPVGITSYPSVRYTRDLPPTTPIPPN